MKTYHIKPEYLDQWGEDATEETVLTEDDVRSISLGWSMQDYEVEYQLIPDDGEYRFWFAVQRDREDDWGTGSNDLEEAKRMATTQQCNLIAVIENDTCIAEITDF